MPLKRAGLRGSRTATGQPDSISKRLEQLRRRRKLISKVKFARVISELRIGQLYAAPEASSEDH